MTKPAAPLALRLGITACWFAGITAFLRFWEVTLETEAFLLWTTIFTALYLGSRAALEGRALFSSRHPAWMQCGIWLGIVALAVPAYFWLPDVRLYGRQVPRILLTGGLDVLVPIWIAVRALAVIWNGPARWAAIGSVPIYSLALMWAFVIRMPGTPFSGSPPPLDSAQLALKRNLERHVSMLADSIGERSARTPASTRAAALYITATLSELGYRVDTMAYTAGRNRTLHYNLEVRVPGSGELPDLVVGAHYDTAEDTPGADDNASGTAAVLELARIFRATSPARTVRFVFFSTEEPPFFGTRQMGSWHYAARAAARKERLYGMISVETIGYYSDEPGSQSYPPPFDLFYPDRGNFVAFVSNLDSGDLLRRAIRVFRERSTIPAHGAASPAFVPGISWSDHQSFWLHGYRAIMISDTAPFRNPYYHSPEDRPARLDFDRMARVVYGLAEVIEDLISQ
ncbi:MAG: hypothetical protein KatS3mg081_2578 [Gemmatimonadales bacterium]|nr:Aminopeptidase YwaD [bacterium HR33]GIW53223.1 MAG: hypothetical protein KatS3mg081_2578 [Gemmatimonadales bacterium]